MLQVRRPQRAGMKYSYVCAICLGRAENPLLGELESIADSVELQTCRFGGSAGEAIFHNQRVPQARQQNCASCRRARRAIAFESPRQPRLGSGPVLSFPVWPGLQTLIETSLATAGRE